MAKKTTKKTVEPADPYVPRLPDKAVLEIWQKHSPEVVRRKYRQAWNRVREWRMRYLFGDKSTKKYLERALIPLDPPSKTVQRSDALNGWLIEWIPRYQRRFSSDDAIYKWLEKELISRDVIKDLASETNKHRRPGAAVRARADRLVKQGRLKKRDRE